MSDGNTRRLVDTRERTHGTWPRTAHIAQSLKSCLEEAIRKSPEPLHFTSGQREALEMILAKIARIVSGDPNHADHWDDIAGYARLARGDLEPAGPDRGGSPNRRVGMVWHGRTDTPQRRKGDVLQDKP